uniref:Uncharacterized protein n=1 Tax=viral metagenome TaxID=1070528 RepID=A0A6C0BNK7_9ZZZZ
MPSSLYDLPQDVLFSTALYGGIPEALQSDYIVNVMEGIIPNYPWCRHYIIEKYRRLYEYEMDVLADVIINLPDSSRVNPSSQGLEIIHTMLNPDEVIDLIPSRHRNLASDTYYGIRINLPMTPERYDDLLFLIDPLKDHERIPNSITFSDEHIDRSRLRAKIRSCNDPDLEGLSQSQVLDMIRRVNPYFNVGEIFSEARKLMHISRELKVLRLDPVIEFIHGLIANGVITRALMNKNDIVFSLRGNSHLSELVTMMNDIHPEVSTLDIDVVDDTSSLYVYTRSSHPESIEYINRLKRALWLTSIDSEPFNTV